MDSTFTANSATGYGGAVALSVWLHWRGQHATVVNCTFDNNIAGGGGGAIDSSWSNLDVTNSRFLNNGAAVGGGAIYGWSFPTGIDITNSSFHGNLAGILGGAIWFYAGKQSSISHSTFVANKAGYAGGAIHLTTSTSPSETFSFLFDTIERNAAPLGGGIFVEGGNGLVVHNSTLTRNRAAPVQLDFTNTGSLLPNSTTRRKINLPTASLPYEFAGGGIFSYVPTVILNSTISGNGSRGTGGGIFTANSLALSFVTLADNKAAEGGGNLYAAQTNPSLLQIKNSILQNGTPQNCFAENANSIQSRGGNLSSDSSCASWSTQTQDRNRVNSLLGPIANNGGETRTRALLPSSPAIHNAIDCGDTDDVPVLQDQRVFPRAEPCDTGAYQVRSR